MASLRGAAIVILARKHNPSIASKEWLEKKRIVTGPFGQFIHNDTISVMEGQHIALMLDESRLNLSLRKPAEDNTILLKNAALRFVKSLPETPYSAVGLNFTFVVPTGHLTLDPVLETANETLLRLFGEAYELVGNATFKFEDFGVKINFPAAPARNGVAEASFNFHSDVNGQEEAAARIKMHRAALRKAETIVEGLAPDG